MPNTQIPIAEAFEPLFTSDFLDFVLPGGRSSGKSKTSAILAGIQSALKPNEDILIARASYGSIADTVYNETQEVLDSIPAFEDAFLYRKSPLRIIRKKTKSTIYFMGIGGSIDRTKGFHPKHKIGLIILEETQELRTQEHLDQALASLRRRFGDECKVVIIFNPPAQRFHWINVWCKDKELDPDTCVIHTTWEDVLPFLSDREIKEILKYKYNNPLYYEYIYGGKPTGALGSVYPMFAEDRHLITVSEFDICREKGLRVVGCVIGGDGAVTRDATAFVPLLLLSNGQVAVAPIFYHNPNDDGVIGYHQLVQNNLTRWFEDLCRRYNLVSAREKREHPTANALPIWMIIDSAAPDLIQECKFFLGDRCDIRPVRKASIFEMVGVVQSAIQNDNVVIVDYGGYNDYQTNRFIPSKVNLLVKQITDLEWNEKETGYKDEIPNDVCDAFTYGTLFWFGNQENIQFFNILKSKKMTNNLICDILKR